MKMTGLHVRREGDALYMAPLTSRRAIGRAWMLVPLEAVPGVASAMLRLCGADDVRGKAA